MLDELNSTIRTHLAERLSSPLLPSFVISWAIWNYRFILVLLSSEPVRIKFQIIETIIFPSNTAWLTTGIAYPLVTALAYIYLYPYPAKAAFRFNRQRQKDILQIRCQIEEDTPLTAEASRKLRQESNLASRMFLEEIDQKDKEIDRLRLIIAESNSGDKARQTNEKAGGDIDRPKLPDSYISILEALETRGGEAEGEVLIELSKLPRTFGEYVIGELERKSLIRTSVRNGREHYKFTHEGRRELLKSKNFSVDPLSTSNE